MNPKPFNFKGRTSNEIVSARHQSLLPSGGGIIMPGAPGFAHSAGRGFRKVLPWWGFSTTRLLLLVMSVIWCGVFLAGCQTPRRVVTPATDPAALSDIAFLHYLASVPVVSTDEAMRAVLLLVGETKDWPSFEERKRELIQRGAYKTSWCIQSHDAIDKGTFAFMLRVIANVPPTWNERLISGATGLGDRRFALRNCIHSGLLSYSSADSYVMGGEVLTAITAVEGLLAKR